MAVKQRLKEAQCPLILSANRLMESFAKSNDERDYYLERQEGFLLYADLDKSQEALDALNEELLAHPERYVLIPKMTYYEAKKLMEQFVNEKVYDIDTKEKLLDIIGAKEARENFLEFLYDHHNELEKWQQFYQERSRIRIIEWLRETEFRFVFEEDLDLTMNVLEKVKQDLFSSKVSKEVEGARQTIEAKSKTYYSNEALNPRPKRGRPPKQQKPVEVEPQLICDVYTTVPAGGRPFLFTLEITHPSQVTFSDKYDTEAELLASFSGGNKSSADSQLESLNQKLAELRQLSGAVEAVETEPEETPLVPSAAKMDLKRLPSADTAVQEEEPDWQIEVSPWKKLPVPKKKGTTVAKKAAAPKKPAAKKSAEKKPATKKAAAKKPAAKKAAPKKTATKKKK